MPETISFNQEGIYPEGLVYDAIGQRFLVSSFNNGAIGQVKDYGSYSTFVNYEQLISKAGIYVDSPRNRVLVATAVPGTSVKRSITTQGKLTAIAIYNLTTRVRTNYIDLGNLKPLLSHFANDIAVDSSGNAYITDSFSGIIYKVDLSGNVTIFLENSQLAAPNGSFGLNGIVYHPNGYLIVTKYNEGLLYKIPVSDPNSCSQIVIPQEIFSADGISFDNDGLLVVACNNPTNKVFKLATTNNWNTASIAGIFETGDVFPTTLAKRNNEMYVLYSYLGGLFSGQNPPVSTYKIKKLSF